MKFISELTVSEIEGMQMGGDKMIAAAAWVSTSAQEALERANAKPEDVEFIIPYLMKHRHGSPFEHGALTVYTHLPIFVYREWHRHRIGFSYNEESARYKTLEPVFYIPPIERPMFKVENWKAGRPKFMTIDENIKHNDDFYGLDTVSSQNYDNLCNNLTYSYGVAYESYLDNLSMGFDPGLSRDCLPVGIYSSCWVTFNPRSCMSFLSLRVHDETSKFVSYPLWEIDQAARKLEEIFAKYWPLTHKAFVENGRVSP